MQGHDQEHLRDALHSTVPLNSEGALNSDRNFPTDHAFGHRQTYRARPTGTCAVRLRCDTHSQCRRNLTALTRIPPAPSLTPSVPSALASVWHAQPQRVLKGFETGFQLQVTSPSYSCVDVRDRAFSLKHHKVCGAARRGTTDPCTQHGRRRRRGQCTA